MGSFILHNQINKKLIIKMFDVNKPTAPSSGRQCKWCVSTRLACTVVNCWDFFFFLRENRGKKNLESFRGRLALWKRPAKMKIVNFHVNFCLEKNQTMDMLCWIKTVKVGLWLADQWPTCIAMTILIISYRINWEDSRTLQPE